MGLGMSISVVMVSGSARISVLMSAGSSWYLAAKPENSGMSPISVSGVEGRSLLAGLSKSDVVLLQLRCQPLQLTSLKVGKWNSHLPY
jgi:hypothetical protein